MAPATIPTTLAVIFPTLALAAVTARFTARHKKRLPYKKDDWVIVAALVLCIANGVALLIGAIDGNAGKPAPLNAHGAPIITPKYVVFKKCVYVMEILTTAAIAVARLSILLFYHRIFIGRLFSAWVWTLYLLNGIWGVAYTFVFMFPCNPIHGWWDLARGNPARHCFPLYVQQIYAISSVVIDILMLVIPWPQILRSMMSKREKVAVLSVFGLGALVIGVAIAKANEFFKVARIMKGGHHTNYDEATALYYAIPESCVAVVCACLPTLRPLVESATMRTFLGSMKSLLSRSSRSSKSSKYSNEGEKRLDTPQTPSEGAVSFERAMPNLPPFMTDTRSAKTHLETSKSASRVASLEV